MRVLKESIHSPLGQSGFLMETEENPVEFPIDGRECSVSESRPFCPAVLRLLACTAAKCTMLE